MPFGSEDYRSQQKNIQNHSWNNCCLMPHEPLSQFRLCYLPSTPAFVLVMKRQAECDDDYF